jgi:large subunit ribosomal protein L15
VKRLPEKRGFVNIFRTEYQIVNLKSMDSFPPDSDVTPQEMLRIGLVDNLRKPIKILGDGDVSRHLVVKAHRFSASAEKKITDAGGRVERL